MSRVYVALDIEATGLSTDRDAIIEIGAVKFRGDESLEIGRASCRERVCLYV